MTDPVQVPVEYECEQCHEVYVSPMSAQYCADADAADDRRNRRI